MAQLAVAAVMLAAGVYKGRQQQQQKMDEANAYLDASDRRKAAMTRDIDTAVRAKETMDSRARAVAAVQGGGGLGTSGMTRLMGDLNAEGEYNVLATMWKGLDEAGALRFQGESALREGEAAAKAGWIDGITSAVSSYYGMGGTFGLSQGTKVGGVTTKKLTIPKGYSEVPGYDPRSRNA